MNDCGITIQDADLNCVRSALLYETAGGFIRECASNPELESFAGESSARQYMENLSAVLAIIDSETDCFARSSIAQLMQPKLLEKFKGDLRRLCAMMAAVRNETYRIGRRLAESESEA